MFLPRQVLIQKKKLTSDLQTITNANIIFEVNHIVLVISKKYVSDALTKMKTKLIFLYITLHRQINHRSEH